MPLYKCNKCSYETYDKNKYDSHLNRKFPCAQKIDKQHGNIKPKDGNKCEHCGRVLAAKSSLTRHIESQHNITNENHGTQENPIMVSVNGDNNTVNTNQHIDNSITNITNNITNIHPYDYYDILSLPIIGQYRIITDKRSPYRKILDYFNLSKNNPEYHNIRLPDLHRKYVNVYTDEWMKEVNDNAISKLIASHKDIIGVLLDRFRIFVNDKAFDLIPKAYMYGSGTDPDIHKKLSTHIKIHLFNHRNKKLYTSPDILKEKTNKIFWALSKDYEWQEVEDTITELDNLNIDFHEDLTTMNKKILQKNIKSQMTPNLYIKLVTRLDKLRRRYKKSKKNTEDPLIETSWTKFHEKEDQNKLIK